MQSPGHTNPPKPIAPVTIVTHGDLNLSAIA
jgi:hypothetical protein